MSKLPSTGQVVKSGDTLLEIFSGPSYVLAFIPTGTLYQIKPGSKVIISNGFQDLDGEITELLPIAESLPNEFQQSFGTKRQGQVVRIQLLTTADLPVFTKVSVKGDHWKKMRTFWNENDFFNKARQEMKSLMVSARDKSKEYLTQSTVWGNQSIVSIQKFGTFISKISFGTKEQG